MDVWWSVQVETVVGALVELGSHRRGTDILFRSEGRAEGSGRPAWRMEREVGVDFGKRGTQ